MFSLYFLEYLVVEIICNYVNYVVDWLFMGC